MHVDNLSRAVSPLTVLEYVTRLGIEAMTRYVSYTGYGSMYRKLAVMIYHTDVSESGS